MKECVESGVCGFIVVDLPPEEGMEFVSLCGKYGNCCDDYSEANSDEFADVPDVCGSGGGLGYGADGLGPFGSVGSFFSFEPTEGSFEANPPFVPQLILRFVRPVARCLCFAPLSELCAQTAWRSTCTGCSRLRTAGRPAVAVVGITLCASL